MKKTLTSLLALSMLLSLFASCARAEACAPMLAPGVITPLPNGAYYDLDGDGEADSVNFVISGDPDDGVQSYTLTVASYSAFKEACYLNETLYALRLNEYSGTLLLVSDYGPSDDYSTDFYLYEDGELSFAGVIEALPESMRVTGEIITAPVRANVLHTWFHDADFSLARGYAYNVEGDFIVRRPLMYMIPRYLYPMGWIAAVKVDMPLRVSMSDPAISATLPAGASVILCASDDEKWVYLQSVDGSARGWLEITGEYYESCLINGEAVAGWDAFEGLWYAD